MSELIDHQKTHTDEQLFNYNYKGCWKSHSSLKTFRRHFKEDKHGEHPTNKNRKTRQVAMRFDNSSMHKLCQTRCRMPEARFLPVLKGLAEKYPRLKIVLEHCTTADAVEAVKSLGENAVGTIRIRTLVNTQVVYFRRLFLTCPAQRAALFDAVGDMLADPQLKVCNCALAILAGIISCSPASTRNPVISALKDPFESELARNPMPKRKVPGRDTPRVDRGGKGQFRW